jgi:hypothetical protein
VLVPTSIMRILQHLISRADRNVTSSSPRIYQRTDYVLVY